MVAVIGPFTSDCSQTEVPILNRAPRGPLAAISPSSTYTGLTRSGPGAAPDEPARYAPTGRRSFLRLLAPDDVQGAADAGLAQRLGIRTVFVLSDGGLYGEGVAAAFRGVARRLGLPVAGTGSMGGGRRIVRRVRASGAEGVFLGGYLLPFGPRLIRALRRAVPSAQLLAPDGFVSGIVETTGPAADGLTVSVLGVPVTALPGRADGSSGASAP